MSRLLKYFASEFFRVSFERRKIGKSTNWKRKGSLWKNNPITETACSFMRPEPVALPCVFSFAQQIRCAAPLLKKKKKKRTTPCLVFLPLDLRFQRSSLRLHPLLLASAGRGAAASTVLLARTKWHTGKGEWEFQRGEGTLGRIGTAISER